MFSSSNPLLDARLQGLIDGDFDPSSEGTTGASGSQYEGYKYKDFYYYFNFQDISSVEKSGFFNGVQVKTWGAHKKDKVELRTEYYVQPLDEWKHYKKFAKDFYLWD